MPTEIPHPFDAIRAHLSLGLPGRYRIWVMGSRNVSEGSWQDCTIPLMFGWAEDVWSDVPWHPEHGCGWWCTPLRAYVIVWPADDSRAPAEGYHPRPVPCPVTPGWILRPSRKQER